MDSQPTGPLEITAEQMQKMILEIHKAKSVVAVLHEATIQRTLTGYIGRLTLEEVEAWIRAEMGRDIELQNEVKQALDDAKLQIESVIKSMPQARITADSVVQAAESSNSKRVQTIDRRRSLNAQGFDLVKHWSEVERLLQAILQQVNQVSSLLEKRLCGMIWGRVKVAIQSWKDESIRQKGSESSHGFTDGSKSETWEDVNNLAKKAQQTTEEAITAYLQTTDQILVSIEVAFHVAVEAYQYAQLNKMIHLIDSDRPLDPILQEHTSSGTIKSVFDHARNKIFEVVEKIQFATESKKEASDAIEMVTHIRRHFLQLQIILSLQSHIEAPKANRLSRAWFSEMIAQIPPLLVHWNRVVGSTVAVREMLESLEEDREEMDEFCVILTTDAEKALEHIRHTIYYLASIVAPKINEKELTHTPRKKERTKGKQPLQQRS